MAVERFYPTPKEVLFEAFDAARERTHGSTPKKLSHAKRVVRATEVAVAMIGYNFSDVADLLVLSMSVYKFPSLVGRIQKVDTRFVARGKLNRTIYVLKITKSTLSCAKLLNKVGVPFFVELFACSKECVLPVAIAGTRVSVELSAGLVITALSVSATTVSIVRDLNKVYQGLRDERVYGDGRGNVVALRYAVHLLKSSLKITQVVVVIIGVSNPLVSVTLVVATLGVGFAYDMVSAETVESYFVGVSLIANGPDDKPKIS